MKKRSTWQSKLTKTELEHLKKDAFEPEVRITLDSLKGLFEHRADIRRKYPQFMHEPCWECRKIARKLGFEV